MNKRQKKTLLILGGVVLLAAVLVCALLLWPKEGDEEGSKITIPLSQRTADQVQKITVENELGSYTFERTGTEEWTVPLLRDSGVPIDRTDLTNCARYAAELSAETLVAEDLEKAAEFGLDDPTAFATIEYTDGGKLELEFGDPYTGNNGYYFKLKGENTIYGISLAPVSFLTGSVLDFADLYLSPFDDTSSDNVTSFRFTNKNGAFAVDNIGDQNVIDGYGTYYKYQMTSPVTAYVDPEYFHETFADLMRIQASSAKILNPTEGQLADAGLDVPISTIELGEGEDFTRILIGKKDGDGYYAVKEGIPVIYRIADYVVTWLDCTPYQMSTKALCAPSMDQVSAVEVAFDGENYRFDIADAAQNKASYGGKELNAASFKDAYKLFCSLRSEYTADAPDRIGETEVQITFHLKDGSTRRVELCSYENRRLAVRVDGSAQYAVRKAAGDAMKNGVKALIAGEAVTAAY
ncbi:DUF4340 domain-containing protein [Bittarella sp. HCP28S3_D9]|uniref:DUF4340 domain-containing protein n=1 Tax=Bittarella sp. HCP28S3_D9 TaxID=3440253 RepID=UPI003F88E6B0